MKPSIINGPKYPITSEQVVVNSDGNNLQNWLETKSEISPPLKLTLFSIKVTINPQIPHSVKELP